MPEAAFRVILGLGGQQVDKTLTIIGDHPNPYVVVLPAGTAGTLTTRTDNNTGVATLAGGHGLTTGDKVDAYWSGGFRYGMDATVAVNDITIDGGVGDNLPLLNAAVVVTKQVSINTAIDGDNIQVIGVALEAASAGSTGKGHLDFQDDTDTTVLAMSLVADAPLVWNVAGGQANPFAGAPIVACQASNGSSMEALTLKILSLEDSTP